MERHPRKPAIRPREAANYVGLTSGKFKQLLHAEIIPGVLAVGPHVFLEKEAFQTWAEKYLKQVNRRPKGFVVAPRELSRGELLRMGPESMRTSQVAILLGISRASVLGMRNRGELQCVLLPSRGDKHPHRRVRRDAVFKYARRHGYFTDEDESLIRSRGEV